MLTANKASQAHCIGRQAWQTTIVRSTLSPMAKYVALTLSVYLEDDGWVGGDGPSSEELATATGRHRSSVMVALRELRDLGYLRVDSGGGRMPDGSPWKNAYTAMQPPQ